MSRKQTLFGYLFLQCFTLYISYSWSIQSVNLNHLKSIGNLKRYVSQSISNEQVNASHQSTSSSSSSLNIAPSERPLRVTSLDQLNEVIEQGFRVQDVDVRGDCFSPESRQRLHPVPSLLYDRLRSNSQPGQRNDSRKIALAIEGGGMRGCVAGGMVSALWYLGLQDTIDVVYGSSAGSLVGAYFVSRQLPYFGSEIYYDVLTSAGQEFIDAQAILRACGLGLFDLRADSLIKLFTDRMGKPVINLDFLLDTIMQVTKPLDWETFYNRQISKNQTLKVVASGLLSKKSVAMSVEDNNFHSLQDLANCMKASMLLPGVSGDTVRLKVSGCLPLYVDRVD